MKEQQSLKSNETHARFKDAHFYDPSLSITILGLGGIGSFLAHVLCRQGYEMYLYDDDIVEIHNVGSQLYNKTHLNRNKAEVAVQYCKEFSNDKAVPMGRFTEESPVDNIMFACFDNMKYRKIAFDKWLAYQVGKTPEYRKANSQEINVYFDLRMSAESWQVYMITNKQNAEDYKLTLFDDSEVPDLPCSYKATCQTGMGIASYTASLFLNHVANKKLGIEIRQIFYKTLYDASLLRYEQHV